MIGLVLNVVSAAAAALMFVNVGQWSAEGNRKRAWISGVIGTFGLVVTLI